MSETTQVFDASKPFIVEINSGGIRRAELNYPSDAQWITRTNAQKIVRTDLGRGKTKSAATPIEAHDQALFQNRLIAQPEKEFDEYDASLAIDRLARVDEVQSEMQGDDCLKVSMVVFGGALTTHTLRMPRRREVVEYSQKAVSMIGTAKGSEMLVSLEPSARLYDKLVVDTSGYAADTAIPIVHKDAVVTELIKAQSPEV